MQYALMVYEPAADFERREGAEAEAYWAQWSAYVGQLRAAGILVGGEALQPPWTATTVAVRDGARAVQDGPYAEAVEQLGGFFVVEVADLDAALHWAAQAPAAETGRMEVRPVLMRSDNPAERAG